MTTKRKSKKMDPKLVAAKQKAEISYLAKTHKAPVKVVREVVAEVGRSRAKVKAALVELGYITKTKK